MYSFRINGGDLVKNFFMKKIVLVILCIALSTLFFLSACEKNVEVTGIDVEEKEITLAVGEKAYITAYVLPILASDKKLDYKSSDDGIADVRNGIVYGKKEGKCKITVKTKEGGFEKYVDINVKKNVLSVSKGYDLSDELYGKYRFGSIAEAFSAAEDGDVISIEKGVYEEYVSLTRNVTVYGNGAKLIGTIAIGSPTLEKPARSVLISDLDFSYNGKTPCIKIGGESKNVVISNCTFTSANASGYAVATDKTGESSALSNIKILSSNFSGFENAVRLNKYVAKCMIKDVNVSDTKYAFFFEGSQKTTIKNTATENCGFIEFKRARVLPSDLVLEQNTVSGTFENLPIIVARAGDIDKNCKIDLSDNYIFGKKVSEMTEEEKYDLMSKIEVKNDDTGAGTYKNFVFSR